MDVAAFRRNFPPGVIVPRILRDLLQFQNRAPGEYSGHFELTALPFGKIARFASRRDIAEKLVVLGKEGDGALYCLWMRPTLTVETAPVAFIGAEGTDNGVLADNLKQFMSLLAFGADDLGYAANWGNVVRPDFPAPRLDEFREWLKTTFGIVEPSSAEHLITTARENHPEFGMWLGSGP